MGEHEQTGSEVNGAISSYFSLSEGLNLLILSGSFNIIIFTFLINYERK